MILLPSAKKYYTIEMMMMNIKLKFTFYQFLTIEIEIH